MSTLTNPYEEMARDRKAVALSMWIWLHSDETMREASDFAWATWQQDEEWWTGVAEKAGVNVPSPESRHRVAELIAIRCNEIRKGATRESAYDFYAIDGRAACESCNEELATLVTPLGEYCPMCCDETYPEIARLAKLLREPTDV